MDYPSNSQNKKSGPPPEPKPEKLDKVISGEVIIRKQSLGKRARELFIGGSAQSVAGYLAYDIIIPAVKDTLYDVVSMGVDRMLFGDSRSANGSRRRPTQSGSGYGYTNYSSYSSGKSTSGGSRYQKEEPSRQISRRARSEHDFREIVLPTRAEAEVIIERLDDLCDRYSQATVSDLYELLGVNADFTDEKYGWVDMRAAGVSRVRDGYLLDLPRPELLDR
jgi:hypothetical protein